jgi:hypothetical protein
MIMNNQIHARQAHAHAFSREEIAALLVRYPRVSDSEAKRILTFLRKGPHLDVGILTADEKLKPMLDSFMHDHKKHFQLGFGETTAVISAIIGFLLVCWIAVETLIPATG